MARTLSDKAQEWLEMMPPYYSDDLFTQGVLDAMACEYQRIDSAAFLLLAGGFPTREAEPEHPPGDPLYESATVDVFRLMAVWENQLGLTVEPVGRTLADRRAHVLAFIARRKASSEAEWTDGLESTFGPLNDPATGWSYRVTRGTLVIRVPVNSPFTLQQVYALARSVTPAHLRVGGAFGVNSHEGFYLDRSPLDTGAF
jgi:hypothetical protein